MNTINPNIYSARNINILTLGIIIFLLLYFVKCGSDPVPPAKPTTTPAKIEKQLIKDSAESKRIQDSMQAHINKWKKEATATKKDLKYYQALVNELGGKTDSTLSGSEYFVGKEEVQEQLKLEREANEAKDSACNSTIALQENIIGTQAAQLAEKDSFATKMRLSFNNMKGVATTNEAAAKYWKKQSKNNNRGKQLYKGGFFVALIYGIAKTIK